MVTLEIIDAGVKIAAGMLLSGLAFLYYLRRHQSLDSRAEAEIRRRRELFELVAGNVGRVHYVYQQYLLIQMKSSFNWGGEIMHMNEIEQFWRGFPKKK